MLRTALDFMTIHIGINKNTADRFKKKAKEADNIVSRQFHHLRLDEMTGLENPFFNCST